MVIVEVATSMFSVPEASVVGMVVSVSVTGCCSDVDLLTLIINA